MKIKYLAIVCSLLLFSCEPDIENNKRILIEGKIVNSVGEPISDISLASFIENQKLGKGFTNRNGEFSFTSFESFDDDYKILVNSNNINYSSAVIKRTSLDTPENGIYNIGEIELKSVSLLNLKINKTSTEEHQLNWELQYFSTNCEYSFDFISLEPNLLFCHEETSTYNYQQNTGQPDFSNSFKTLRGIAVKFLYTIDNGDEQTIEIPMNEKTIDYEFTY